MIYTYKYKSPLGIFYWRQMKWELLVYGLKDRNIWEYTSRQAYSTGNRDSHGSKKMAGCVFLR